mmetsp:Transcript_14006/g.12376  ORF Transcript_14006/g.12376 Transcript_14006/m.12376 type:complete len:84 (-) Transcript_14006:139-390(-)
MEVASTIRQERGKVVKRKRSQSKKPVKDQKRRKTSKVEESKRSTINATTVTFKSNLSTLVLNKSPLPETEGSKGGIPEIQKFK